MEFALIVYLISTLSSVKSFLVLGCFFSVVATVVILIFSTEDSVKVEAYYKYAKIAFCISILSALLAVLTPSEKTAYVMLGAYTAQKVTEQPETKLVADKVLKIVNKKLDSYIEELQEKK